MSEFPIAAEIIRFAWGVIAAAREEAARAGPPETEPLRRPCPPAEPAGTPGIGAFWPGADAAQSPRWAALPEARRGAERAASDRGSPDTRAVLEAAYKTGREIDRLMGLLRFTPCFPGGTGSSGGGPVYVARCSPDHHVLPGLAEHFTQRFGECPWAVIDEKRRLVLAGKGGGPARLFPLSPEPAGAIAPGGPADAASPSASGTAPDYGNLPDYNSPSDYYEALWRNYHHSINNPARNNPALQRQFMPRRYWKYLTELQ
jgi:probable DNA metabolism protein